MRRVPDWIIVFGLLWCLTLGPAAGKPLIGISLNVPEGGGGKELERAILDVKASGARLMYQSYKWSDLEPRPGEFHLQEFDKAIPSLTALGFQVYVTLQTLDTNNRTLPPDLQDKPFDSPEVRKRFAALLRALAPGLTSAVRGVSLGNEADVYLGAHPDELEPYAGFVEAGRECLRASRPSLPVGVTTTYDGLRDRPQAFQRLNRAMDVVTMTYYPLTATFQVRPVADVDGDFARMVRATGGRPLLLQEIGYPAAPLLGSSDVAQAAFVDAVFAAVQAHTAQIGFANFFLLYDFGKADLDRFEKYYRVPDPRFRAFLGTLGLKRADGSARPAWRRFQQQAGQSAGAPP